MPELLIIPFLLFLLFPGFGISIVLAVAGIMVQKRASYEWKPLSWLLLAAALLGAWITWPGRSL